MDNIEQLFVVEKSSHTYEGDIEFLKDSVMNLDVTTQHYSQKGGHQSVHSIHTRPEFQKLSQWIEECSKDLSNRIGVSKKLHIQDMWANINTGLNSWNARHIHGGILSGVLWVSAPEGSGHIVFDNPVPLEYWTQNLIDTHTTKINNTNTSQVTYAPQERTCLLWPSYLHHMVEPNKQNVQRISISFNLG